MNPFRLSFRSAAQQEEQGPDWDSGTSDYQLDSNLAGSCFNAAVQASWRPRGREHGATVFHHLRLHANSVTSDFSVLNAMAAENALNKFFATEQLSTGTGIQVLSARATLRVADDVRSLAERRARNVRESQAVIAELAAKQAYLTRWRETFLRDPAAAMLWWADGDRDRLLQLSTKEKEFGAIVSLLGGTPTAPTRTDKIAPLVATFLSNLDVNDRSYLTSQLAKIFENYRRPDLAEELRRSESSDMPPEELPTPPLSVLALPSR